MRFLHSLLSSRPPSRWLLAAFAYTLIALAVAIALSLRTPWLGLRLVPVGEQIHVQASQGPSATVPVGSILLALRATAGGQAFELQASDLMEEPDMLSSYAQMDAFFARQQQITEI